MVCFENQVTRVEESSWVDTPAGDGVWPIVHALFVAVTFAGSLLS